MLSERYKIIQVVGVTGSILYTISRCAFAYMCDSKSVLMSQKPRVIKQAQLFEAVNQIALSVMDIYYFHCDIVRELSSRLQFYVKVCALQC